ncbi:MAG: tetratricopeptide repeat protein, partial [Chloroflexota bacterium]
MISIVRHPALRLGIAFVVIFLLGIQPNWTPLLDDLRIARASSTLNTDSLNAILDAYARQPWQADWARAAALATLGAGDYESAITTITAAASLGGWTPELHIALGDAYNGTGDLDRAIPEWEAARPDRPADASLLTKLAIAYESKGRFEEAAGALRTLVALEPNNAIAQYRFGLMLSVIDPASAPAHLALAA